MTDHDPWDLLERSASWLSTAYAVFVGAEVVPSNLQDLHALVIEAHEAIIRRLEQTPTEAVGKTPSCWLNGGNCLAGCGGRPACAKNDTVAVPPNVGVERLPARTDDER